jgi:hypothetical protein
VAERVERRLTKILAADVAEYSRLMRADEDRTFALLTRCRDLATARIAEHRGRIANTAGDAVLAEFPSVADGVSCALAIQEAEISLLGQRPGETRVGRATYVRHFRQRLPWFRPDDHARWLEDLRKAGWSGEAADYSAAIASPLRRQLMSSSQLGASMNSAQRR